MCRRGNIPYFDVGTGKNREYRFDLEEVKRFLYKKADREEEEHANTAYTTSQKQKKAHQP